MSMLLLKSRIGFMSKVYADLAIGFEAKKTETASMSTGFTKQLQEFTQQRYRNVRRRLGSIIYESPLEIKLEEA